MRIGSLSDYQPANDCLVVFLCSTEKLQPLRASHRTVIFCFDEQELAAVKHLPIVLVDVPPNRAVSIFAHLIREGEEVEYWVPRTATANLRGLVGRKTEVKDDFAISGLHVSDSWIHLRISKATGETRGADDFLKGLAAPYSGVNSCFPIGVASNDSGSNASPGATTVRSILILRAAALAKPLKNYLPPRAVVFLYKILEKIR